MRSSKPNMTLNVAVELSGKAGALRIDFALAESDPPLRDPRGVVTSDGTIDLRLLPCDPRYGSAVAIVFELTGEIEIHGRRHAPVFASPATRGFQIKRKPLHALKVFKASFPRGARPGQRSTLIVDNRNNDGKIWEYGLSFRVSGLPGWIGQYDPAIINRGKPGSGNGGGS